MESFAMEKNRYFLIVVVLFEGLIEVEPSV